MLPIIIYWFKTQASRAAKKVLITVFNHIEVHDIIIGYWQRYLKLKKEVPEMPTMGGSLMLHLSAMSTAFYYELIARGKSEETTTKLFYEIAWIIYQKMGKLSWQIAGLGNYTKYNRLLKATQLFRSFPFNSPSYIWQDVETIGNTVGFDCMKCPVAEYFQTKGLSKFCASTWCALDYPLAEMWEAKLERTGIIAGGAEKCDFRWRINSNHFIPHD